MKENSIEKNIEILEKFKNDEMQRDKLERDVRCGGWKIGDLYKCLELDNAIEHILSDYKRVLKENEILKEEKEQAWGEWNNLEQGSYETEQKLKQQIKKLQKENEELRAKWDKDTHILQNKLDYANADRIDLAQQNKELKQDYYNLINKIENKIDRFDYEFEKAKRQNDKDKSDYYWDLIINFKKLLGGE